MGTAAAGLKLEACTYDKQIAYRMQTGQQTNEQCRQIRALSGQKSLFYITVLSEIANK